VLDLCTGNGSLAVLAAMVYPDVTVDAADISADAWPWPASTWTAMRFRTASG
jgi:methylase of polypeptide subunit release factors